MYLAEKVVCGLGMVYTLGKDIVRIMHEGLAKATTCYTMELERTEHIVYLQVQYS